MKNGMTPIITGNGWVSELIEIAGRIDCYAEHARHQGAKDRIVANPMDVVKRRPDIIIGSWCGKRFHPRRVAERQGWDDVPAVRNNCIYEIKSENILQPGPAALCDGFDKLLEIIYASQAQNS